MHSTRQAAPFRGFLLGGWGREGVGEQGRHRGLARQSLHRTKHKKSTSVSEQSGWVSAKSGEYCVQVELENEQKSCYPWVEELWEICPSFLLSHPVPQHRVHGEKRKPQWPLHFLFGL